METTSAARRDDAASTITVALPDGGARSFDRPVTGADVAADVGPGLAKAAIAVRVDGEVRDLHRPLDGDAGIEILTRRSAEALELIRHDAAHVMAEAVQSLFPGTQVTIGPAIEDGFYYDFARAEPFSTGDLDRIEARMREIVARDLPIRREVWDRERAIRFFLDAGETYKAEIVRELPAGDEVTVYRQTTGSTCAAGRTSPRPGTSATASSC